MFIFVSTKRTEMKHHLVTEHVKNCMSCKFDRNLDLYTFVFFVYREFHIVTICHCQRKSYEFEPEFMQRIINNIYKGKKQTKKRLWYNVQRSIEYNENFRSIKSRETIIFKKHSEVNSIYYDNACKKYFILSQVNFVDKIENSISIKKDYEKIIQYVNANFLDLECKTLIKKINDLYYQNTLNHEEFLISKTTEHLILNIQNQLK